VSVRADIAAMLSPPALADNPLDHPDRASVPLAHHPRVAFARSGCEGSRQRRQRERGLRMTHQAYMDVGGRGTASWIWS